VASAVERAEAKFDAYVCGAYFDGKDEGKDERDKEIAKNLRLEGLSPEIIARSTGLPLDYVQKL
jgi:hypothetical protein